MTPRNPIRAKDRRSKTARETRGFQNFHQLLDLIWEDSRRNVHRGELEVRPPGAPTTEDPVLLAFDGFGRGGERRDAGERR